MAKDTPGIKNDDTFFSRCVEKGKAFYAYCSEGVWCDTRTTWWVTVIKTLNLSVTSFLNKDAQSKACAMAYRTLLATVPALALLLAIGRGFGFSSILQDSLFKTFPAQRTAIEAGLKFVDSYLSQASEGIFVGVGILFLLWTLISLAGSAEQVFNEVWGVTHGRSLWRKITDYTAILLILPILMICATGINIMMSTTLQNLIHIELFTPVISMVIDFAGVVLTWLFFAGAYMLVPNTKVRFRNAFMAGVLSGTAFIVLQWLFVTGQLYVSKYNAIYGSFSFLPLMMIWLQLVWVITLAGAVVCFSSQNIFRYSFSTQISRISFDYRRKILLAVMSIIACRFRDHKTAPNPYLIATDYGFPPRLVTGVVNELNEAGLLLKVSVSEDKNIFGYVPSLPLQELTVGTVLRRLRESGETGFIPAFNEEFSAVGSLVDKISRETYQSVSNIYITDLCNVDLPVKN